ncbi:MAG: alkaline phosphatase [Candidatus Sumerlaeales bacterium]|nr:alkaline phosphatase [Candidatus Sumerlaeales bacterium]
MKHYLAIASLVFALATASQAADNAKNVILFIGDGMGFSTVAAASDQLNGTEINLKGDPGKLSFEEFPVFGYLTNHSASSYITDSAASGTAIACGIKTYNGAVGVDKDKVPHENLGEVAGKIGKSVGVVTSVSINDATPSVFYAHNEQRASGEHADKIISQAFEAPFLKVLMGGGCIVKKLTIDDVYTKAKETGFTTLETKDELANLDAEKLGKEKGKLFGIFNYTENKKKRSGGMLDYETSRTKDNDHEPHLKDLNIKAVELLAQDPNGFFLMTEAGSIDGGGHSGMPQAAIMETLQLNECVAETVDYLKKKNMLDETLIIVTSDHETGGFTLNKGYDKIFQKGDIIEMQHNTKGHTGLPVMVWAMGPGAEKFNGKGDNTDIYKHVKEIMK